MKVETKAAKLGSGGTIAIPENFLDALGVKAGDELIVALKDGELSIYTRSHAIKQAQAMVRRLNPEGRILSEDLIEERRAEAAAVEAVIAARKAEEAASE